MTDTLEYCSRRYSFFQKMAPAFLASFSTIDYDDDLEWPSPHCKIFTVVQLHFQIMHQPPVAIKGFLLQSPESLNIDKVFCHFIPK